MELCGSSWDGLAGDRWASLRVIDHGPGVPPESLDRIFEPFQRLGDVPRGDGVGLGLAVARGLLEAMGGTLGAEETPGGGLTMVIDLPAAPAQDMSGPALPEPVEGRSGSAVQHGRRTYSARAR